MEGGVRVGKDLPALPRRLDAGIDHVVGAHAEGRRAARRVQSATGRFGSVAAAP